MLFSAEALWLRLVAKIQNMSVQGKVLALDKRKALTHVRCNGLSGGISTYSIGV